MRIGMVQCEKALMDEIADVKMTRRDVAKTYALTIKSPEFGDINFDRVNQAIIARWSRSGLEWIKKQAWTGDCFDTESEAAQVAPRALR